MNIANLQLEGLYLAVAAINDALVQKNILTRDEVSLALRRAEQMAVGDDRMEELSGAEREAVAFAPRLLLLANDRAMSGPTGFSDLARLVGQTKRPHPDQL